VSYPIGSLLKPQVLMHVHMTEIIIGRNLHVVVFRQLVEPVRLRNVNIYFYEVEYRDF